MPSPLLMPNPLLPLSPDMLMAVMVSVMLTVMVVLMDTDTPMLMLDTITAKDLLNPLLSPPLLLNLDTVTVMLTVTDTDTDMVTVMLTDTDTPMLDILVTITAKGLLMPNLKQRLMPKLESHTTALLMVPILMVSVPTVPILMLSVDTTVMVS